MQTSPPCALCPAFASFGRLWLAKPEPSALRSAPCALPRPSPVPCALRPVPLPPASLLCPARPMKAVAIKEISQELLNLTPRELRDLCLRLARFKKENKEFLTYLLFESSDEASYVESVKGELDRQFELVNRKSYYFIKKGIRKVLTNARKYIRYSGNKKTEIDLMIYCCLKLKKFTPPIQRNAALRNLYIRQLDTIREKLSSLHEDLQGDYEEEIRNIAQT